MRYEFDFWREFDIRLWAFGILFDFPNLRADPYMAITRTIGRVEVGVGPIRFGLDVSLKRTRRRKESPLTDTGGYH